MNILCIVKSDKYVTFPVFLFNVFVYLFIFFEGTETSRAIITQTFCFIWTFFCTRFLMWPILSICGIQGLGGRLFFFSPWDGSQKKYENIYKEILLDLAQNKAKIVYWE